MSEFPAMIEMPLLFRNEITLPWASSTSKMPAQSYYKKVKCGKI